MYIWCAMSRNSVGPGTRWCPPRGLVLLLCLQAAGLALAWPGYDREEDTVDPRLPGPLASMEDERSMGYSQPVRHRLYGLMGRSTPKEYQPSPYDLMQHALWDKKMAADDWDDGEKGEEAGARDLDGDQPRLGDRFLEEILREFQRELQSEGFDLPGEGGYGDDPIEVRRRSGLPDTCGQMTGDSQVSKRVVMGQETAEGRWPWLVQLEAKDGKQPYCGGTLISSDYVMTAAHCFDRHNPNDVTVILGDRDRLTKEGTEQRFGVECVRVHEDYQPNGKYRDDIALVRLKTAKKSVQLGPAVQPACLPPKQKSGAPDLFKAPDRCFVVGFGFTDPLTYFNSQHPAVLHEARLPILDPKSCRDAYGDLYTDRMICAGSMTGKQRADACKGDSGGPLMCQGDGGEWVAWGVVSWGHNYFCNGSPDKPIPTVYTKVVKYMPWIKQTLRGGQC